MNTDWHDILKDSLKDIRFWSERMPIELLDRLVGLIGREDNGGWQ